MCWLQQSAQLWYYPSFLLIPLAVIAGIECFAGFFAWRFLIGINGAVLGFIGGAMFCAIFGTPMMMLVGALAGGIIGAVFFANITSMGTFVVVLGSTVSLILLLGHLLGMPDHLAAALAALVGLGTAISALVWRRPVIVAITAIAGAQQLHCAYTTYFLPGTVVPVSNTMATEDILTILGMAVCGLSLQLVTTRDPKPSVAEQGTPISGDRSQTCATAGRLGASQPEADGPSEAAAVTQDP